MANDPGRGGESLAARRRLTLLACILGSSAVFLDGTLVNVALPAIRADLGGGLGTQEWIVDGYLLTLGSLLLVGGSLGDVLGRRRVFAGGVAGFGVASLLCAVAPDPALLIAARALQGVAGALLVPSTLALIVDTFPQDQRAAAIGSWTAWSGIATAIGPLAGGLLVQAGSWRWIFIVNLPLVLVTLYLVEHAPPGSRLAHARVDWVGGALCALGLGGPIFALIEQPRYGWSDGRVAGPLIAGVALLAGFLAWERRARSPMLPLELFRARNFTVGNLATFAFYAALNVALFFLVLYLQEVAGYSPLRAGLALLPISVLAFLLARRFGALAGRFGPRLFMGLGPMLVGAGLLLLLRVDAHAPYASQVLPGVVLFALGLSMTVAPLTATVLSGVESDRSGVASGVNNAIARVAGLIAIAAVGAAVAGEYAAAVAERIPTGGSPALAAAVRHAGTRAFVIDVSDFPPARRPQARSALIGASENSYRLALEIAAPLAILSGLVSLFGIINPSRRVPAGPSPGGGLSGAGSGAGAPAAGGTPWAARPKPRQPPEPHPAPADGPRRATTRE